MRLKEIKGAFTYLHSDAEFAVMPLVPKVLKKGIELPGHDDHKERNYGITTFAAPVTLDDAVVNMAVVVKNTGKHHYKLHRVIYSDGTSITGNKKGEPGILSLTNSGQRLSAEFSNGIIKSNKKKSNEDSTKKQNFALRAPVEETKDLIAVHNATEKNVRGLLRLGGLPMPSIAIIKDAQGHDDFGEYSFVFDKSTIDPTTNRNNKVYGSDAFTPVAPHIEYEVKDDKAYKEFQNGSNMG
ncbi:MAG: hypothetical protein MSS24_01645 [Clostridiales bacterium]|nr:hypothetical protein [Clostridiales bacterium]